jgi:hypothetical protein
VWLVLLIPFLNVDPYFLQQQERLKHTRFVLLTSFLNVDAYFLPRQGEVTARAARVADTLSQC